jgi:hypothetical protein
MREKKKWNLKVRHEQRKRNLLGLIGNFYWIKVMYLVTEERKTNEKTKKSALEEKK